MLGERIATSKTPNGTWPIAEPSRSSSAFAIGFGATSRSELRVALCVSGGT